VVDTSGRLWYTEIGAQDHETEKSAVAVRPRKIICIEDEPEMIDLIRVILSHDGHQVIGAIGGRAGLEAMRADKPDLVVLDLMMPDMDGWQAHRQMMADEELKTIPVVVVTAKAQSIDRVLGLHVAEVDDYITKPFGPDELRKSVARILGR